MGMSNVASPECRATCITYSVYRLYDGTLQLYYRSWVFSAIYNSYSMRISRLKFKRFREMTSPCFFSKFN